MSTNLLTAAVADIIRLRVMDTLDGFCCHVYKGDNFYDFITAFCVPCPVWKESTLKVVPFSVEPWDGSSKNSTTDLPSPKVYPFTLIALTIEIKMNTFVVIQSRKLSTSCILLQFTDVPVYVLAVHNPGLSGGFTVPPRPGLIAYLQRRHCLDLHFKVSVDLRCCLFPFNFSSLWTSLFLPLFFYHNFLPLVSL